MVNRTCILLIIFSVLGITGCTSTTSQSVQDVHTSSRNRELANQLTQQAIEFISIDTEQAKKVLRQALDADLYHGPAHNNLGVVLLNQGRLYEAAEEFDWARRLMPGHPDPRINLGVALERGGKVDDALEAYASAIEVYPGHLSAIQALAQLQIRAGIQDEYTDELLKEIVYRGDSKWSDWAKSQLKRD